MTMAQLTDGNDMTRAQLTNGNDMTIMEIEHTLANNIDLWCAHGKLGNIKFRPPSDT